ncbi:hypothetical protein E2C01_073031 [Portunus trituberculatus]|uniref:Uncharacterized protein n=1 Tax=Portunus trituberculatus TaxID=210409 RepID=A0A5B7I8A8_PORTR|nr:hypothetical protein [Portunus trituberculatus]
MNQEDRQRCFITSFLILGVRRPARPFHHTPTLVSPCDRKLLGTSCTHRLTRLPYTPALPDA